MLTPEGLARCLTPLALLWSRTLRIRQRGWEPLQAERNRNPVVFTLWHDELFVPCCFHRHQGVIAVVSASKDGEILAQIMRRMGYSLARGSSNREGLRALRSAMRSMQETGRDAVLTLDGPKGPRHEVKEGAIYLAHRVGVPICPARVSISRVKRFERAWDRFQLPLPGARCTIVYGHPYRIEAVKLSSEVMDAEKRKLQDRMDALIEQTGLDRGPCGA